MIKDVIHDPIFLSGKSERATKEDLQVAQVKAGNAPKQCLWAGVMEIAVGKKSVYMDLCTAATASVTAGSIMCADGLSIQPAAIIAEYKKLTGVDLVEHGIASIFMN